MLGAGTDAALAATIRAAAPDAIDLCGHTRLDDLVPLGRACVVAIGNDTGPMHIAYALGTPLVADPFHANRWDYIFTLRRPGAELQRRSVVVHFDGDVVRAIEAPDLPSEREFVASITRPRTLRTPRLELSAEERAALPVPPRREAPAPEPIGPVRSYPPLERS